jgi:hypothetical protein
LTPRALAYWLASDGTYKKDRGVVVLCTDSFTADEVDLLRSILLEKYGIDSTRNVHRPGQFRIRIPKREVPKLQQLVKPFIPSIMASRVGLKASPSD